MLILNFGGTALTEKRIKKKEIEMVPFLMPMKTVELSNNIWLKHVSFLGNIFCSAIYTRGYMIYLSVPLYESCKSF